MKISILTATYNREKLLHNLYKSIDENYTKYKDIEWIIMDDGSSDNTKKVVEKWIKHSKFKIDYHYQENQGKMTAINKGMQYVNGDIVIEMDSDDYFKPNSLKMINSDFEKLPEDAYGIIYRIEMKDKNHRAKNLDGKVIKLFDIHNKYECDFDMKIAFKASIRKKYKYQLEHGEKFITEARTYYKMDKDYAGLLFLDKEIAYGEYQEDGYTRNLKNVFKKNPYGYYEYFRECLSYIKKDNCTFKRRLYFIRQYILFSYLTNKSKLGAISNTEGFNRFLTSILIIPGYLKSKRWNK